VNRRKSGSKEDKKVSRKGGKKRFSSPLSSKPGESSKKDYPYCSYSDNARDKGGGKQRAIDEVKKHSEGGRKDKGEMQSGTPLNVVAWEKDAGEKKKKQRNERESAASYARQETVGNGQGASTRRGQLSGSRRKYARAV